MAVDNASIHLENINGEILQKFNWQKKQSKNRIEYWEYFVKNTFILNNSSKNYHLKLTLKKDKKTDFYKLIIQNSLRKWYFNKNVKRDLYKLELWDCLYKLSYVLNVPFEKVLNAKITKLEIGFTVALNPIYRKLQEGIYFYKRLERWAIKETTYFGKKNCSYHLKYYDKLTECYKHSKNGKYLHKLNQKIYFLRFEVSVNKISKVSFYKKNTSSFKDVFSNWDIVMNEIYQTAKKVNYIDWMSNFKTNEIETNLLLENENYYYGIQTKGLHTIIQQIANFKSNNKTHYRRRLENFIKDNSAGEYKHLYNNFLSKLGRKIHIVGIN